MEKRRDVVMVVRLRVHPTIETPGGLRVGVTDVWDRGGLGESWLCRVHETRGTSAVDLLYGRCRGCGSLSFGVGCGTSWPYRHN